MDNWLEDAVGSDEMRVIMNRAPGLILICLMIDAINGCAAIRLSGDGHHVFPGDEIQDAIQAASNNPSNKVVKVHAGEYRPGARRQALIWFNKTHDGVRVESVGKVTLTAANPQLGLPSDHGYPAMVNHVVYFGDGSYNAVFKTSNFSVRLVRGGQ